MDTDVLPTLLVYRNGALVHNWVRVDLDAKQERGGIEDLLSRCVNQTGYTSTHSATLNALVSCSLLPLPPLVAFADTRP